MDDGRSFQLTFVGADLKIGTAEVVKPDLTWQNGVIHITKADLP